RGGRSAQRHGAAHQPDVGGGARLLPQAVRVPPRRRRHRDRGIDAALAGRLIPGLRYAPSGYGTIAAVEQFTSLLLDYSVSDREGPVRGAAATEALDA